MPSNQQQPGEDGPPRGPVVQLLAAHLDDMVAAMITKAKAGHMGHARLVLERDVPVTATDIEAIMAAVTAKAATGNRAARRLKALYARRP